MEKSTVTTPVISSKKMAQKPPPKDVDGHGDPINAARRKSSHTGPAVDWSKYKQQGPSCDMDANGDPKPPKVTRR